MLTLIYKNSPKREIQEPQVLGRGYRGQRPLSFPSPPHSTPLRNQKGNPHE